MLLASALADANLFEAWQKVKDNDGAAGVDGQSIETFSVNVFGRLLGLRQMVETRKYSPRPLLEVHIPKDNGKLRKLCIPAVRDRVLQTAVSCVLTPLLEKEFEDASYAYRAGRSVPMAVARVAHYRDQGFQWVVDADITTFFDEISHQLLLEKLRRTLPDTTVLPLIELWLGATVHPEHGQPYLLEKGVPQGSPISPLLSNLYLDDLDEALLDENLRLVRFADDFLILCRSREDAEEALDLTEDVVEALKLRLNLDKTRITHFDQGFQFLGVNFIRNLLRPVEAHAAAWVIPKPHHFAALEKDNDSSEPALISEELPEPGILPDATPPETPAVRPAKSTQSERKARPLPVPPPLAGEGEQEYAPEQAIQLEESTDLGPLLRSLFITEPGHTLLKDNDRLVVTREHRVLASIPLHKLDQVVIHGNQLVSTALFRFARENQIAFHFADYGGGHFSSLDHTGRDHTALHRHQFARDGEEDFRLMLARAFIAGKIRNSRVLLRRYNNRRAISEVETAELLMAEMEQRLATTLDVNAVRGVEGHAAHLYFTALRRFVPASWNFTARQRRPPEDGVNALLSYGYGILHKTMLSLVTQRGLQPWLGALHAARAGHPALVSDLVEEFRAPVVDTLVLQLTLNGTLSPDDFIWDPGAELPCRLGEAARKKFIAMLQNKFRSQLLHPRAGARMDYHRAMQYQVWHYARVIQREEQVYFPFVLR
jgi:CRISPR-associated protein Cas1